MALIPFPADALVTRSELALQHPGQSVLRSAYGAGTQVLARGPGFWAGRLELGESDRASEAERRAIELFLTRLRGSENTFEAPIQRPSGGTLVSGTALTVSAVSDASGIVAVTVSGAAEGLVAGDYVRIDGRLHQLTTDHAGSAFQIEPPVEPPVAAAVQWEAVTCLARQTRQSRASSRLTPHFGGPWTLDWEEAV